MYKRQPPRLLFPLRQGSQGNGAGCTGLFLGTVTRGEGWGLSLPSTPVSLTCPSVHPSVLPSFLPFSGQWRPSLTSAWVGGCTATTRVGARLQWEAPEGGSSADEHQRPMQSSPDHFFPGRVGQAGSSRIAGACSCPSACTGWGGAEPHGQLLALPVWAAPQGALGEWLP